MTGALIAAGCGSTESVPMSPAAQETPSTPSDARTVTVRFVYRASTSPRTDLPPSARDCVQLVGHTHIHPSWRDFARMEMTAIDSNRWEIAFNDVPTNVRQSIRVRRRKRLRSEPHGRRHPGRLRE